MIVSGYTPADADAWDALVARAPMATFLHTRRFLSYHGDRFRDASLVVRGDAGDLVGVLPAAEDPGDPGRVVSHPGATYGGLVHDGTLTGPSMLEALTAVRRHYADEGRQQLVYAAVPTIYHQRPSADDLYALFRLGAARTRCDLSCAVDLDHGADLSSRRRRGLRRAQREGIEVQSRPELVAELWPIVAENLSARHGAAPVHTVDEMRLLLERFPEEISVVAARHDEEWLAGVVLFESARVLHTQYIASTERGRALGALDAVFDHCLELAAERGRRYFDLGTSNREGGRVLNEGLYVFKAQLGGGGVAHEYYELAVDA